MRLIASVLLSLLPAQVANAGVKEALAAQAAGDYETAIAEFTKLAEAGDDKAMISIALLYHQGEGVPQDYSKAMDWYLKAFPLGNGDAYNNIGVMYRDGLGVPVNRPIAYALFLITHLKGLGGEATQYRAGRNLDREAAEQSKDDIRRALCYTEEYVKAYVLARGKIPSGVAETMPSARKTALKDEDWWLESERAGLAFECPR